MAGVERTGVAGAARGGADALLIQHKQQAAALDALKTHVDRTGDMMLHAAVKAAVRDLTQAFNEPVTHRKDPGGVCLHVGAAFLQSGGKRRNARHIFCARA